MAESLPIIELIAVDLLAAVNAVTVANGYYQTLTAVRPKRGDDDDAITGDLTVLIAQGDPEELEGAHGIRQLKQPFYIQVILIDSDDATTPIDTRINMVRSDIEKKLALDETRGGWAFDQRILTPESFNGEGFTGFALPVDISYRTAAGDPFTKA